MSTDLVILTDVPTPYRAPVFAELDARLELCVVYLMQSSFRDWQWWAHLTGHDARFIAEAHPTSPLGWWQAARQTVRMLEELAPRSIVIGGWNHPTSWRALVWARRRRVPCAVWVESTSFDAPRRSVLELVKRIIVRYADAVVVPGSRAAAYARSLGAREVLHAPNAVDNELFVRTVDDATERPPTVLYVGRIATEKGVDVLVDGMEILNRAAPTRLVLVGDGPIREEIERRLRSIDGAHELVGALRSPQEIAPYLWNADVLALPSRREPWGLVVNEAMAAELPVVVTDAVGCGPDLVIAGVTGEICAVEDASGLARALQTVLERGRSDAIRRACRDVAARHSPAASAAGFESFARSTTARRRRTP
jgi:glycosyltransferase involved in cell wall biosynthesis